MQSSSKTSKKDNSHLDQNQESLWEQNQEHNTAEEVSYQQEVSVYTDQQPRLLPVASSESGFGQTTTGNGSPSELQFTRNKNSEVDMQTIRGANSNNNVEAIENAMLIQQDHMPSLSNRVYNQPMPIESPIDQGTLKQPSGSKTGREGEGSAQDQTVKMNSTHQNSLNPNNNDESETTHTSMLTS